MVHSLRESHLRLSVSFLLCCTVFIRAESDAERVRGQWLCRYVRELSAKQYGKNVIGFIEGRYNFTGPMTIDQLEYPSGCAEQMEWRGTGTKFEATRRRCATRCCSILFHTNLLEYMWVRLLRVSD